MKRKAGGQAGRRRRLGLMGGLSGKATASSDNCIPILDAASATFEDFLDVYSTTQCVLVRGCLQLLQEHPPAKRRRLSSSSGARSSGAQSSMRRGLSAVAQKRRANQQNIGLEDLRWFFGKHPKVVRRAFNVEQAPKLGDLSKAMQEDGADAANEILGSNDPPRDPWYASFVVQRSRQALNAFYEVLPMMAPPFLEGRNADVKHSDAIWVFFGQNPRARPMPGRPEHTDAIAHSGTWHLQLRGSKVWALRPTAELKRAARPLRRAGRVLLRCREGDVLCVNTRLWWHSTFIPGRCPLSMSVARDMWLDATTSRPEPVDMTNIDGHYATRSIPEGTVIFTEQDAPDLELPRSRRANCMLAEGSRGELLVVASRHIASGEWFSLAESEDEG